MEQFASRWDIRMTISAGKKTICLVNKYYSDFEPRIKKDEFIDFENNVQLLERQNSGQNENLTFQKISTLNVTDCKNSLHQMLSSLRGVVKCSGASPAMLKAFGYGERISNSPKTLISISNVAIKAYEENKQWCNTQAGILEEDIEEMRQLIEMLRVNSTEQTEAKEHRKLSTVSKNTTQAMVDSAIIRFSTLGAYIFRKKDQRLAQLFADLVPVYKTKTNEDKEEQTNKEANVLNGKKE